MKRYISIFLIFSAVILAYGQDNIGGNDLNSYYKVTALGSNTVTCEDLSGLQVGDKVMLIQMTGAGFFPTTFNIYSGGNYDVTSGSAGMHEYLSVLSINGGANEVTFTANLKNTYSADEKIQLVKIYETQDAVVSSTLSVPAWDGDKGGVLALVVLGNLTLNADIDLSNKGFKGGDSLEYTSGCKEYGLSSGLDTLYYEALGEIRGGEMGEGMLSDTFRYALGGGNSSIGGGGGPGRFGGGAGGGNWGKGGDGGTQLETCDSAVSASLGGFAYGAGGFNNSFALGRASFGGGGGGSTYEAPYNATSGGNGGGLIFLMADTLFANNHSILNKGQSVTTTASAGAGGGGAGGTILLDVSYTDGNLALDVSGGSGGNADINCGGAGGGGSGGLIWHNGSTLPANITPNVVGGAAGDASCGGGEMDGVVGQNGVGLAGFVPNLNGFTFNAISSNDSICNGQIPNPIIGTTPRGTTNYQYKWLQRSNLTDSWTEIGVTTKDYAPPALTDTMYYTREVFFPDDGIRDTAIAVQILVYPAIVDNLIDITDTICYNTTPALLTGNTVSGGDGSYSYYWQASEDQVAWTPKGDESSADLDEQDLLTNTTYYWRIVTSGTKHVCTDTSNVDTITVIPLITNNVFLNTDTDTIICNNLDAGKAIGAKPTGGDGTYRYSWLISNNGVSYTPIASNTQSYTMGTLSSNDYYYKRVVYSGEGDVCRDTTSPPRYVEVLADIAGNLITSDSLRYCSGDAPLELKTEGNISGGNTTYIYQWQQYNGTAWNDIALANSETYSPGELTDTSVYRRIVSSGLVSGSLYACVDQSSSLSVDVIPAIQNSLSSPPETICQDGQPAAFNEAVATGGAGGFTYQWEQKVESAGWENAVGAISTNNSYAPPVLYESTLYRRVAYSQICHQISDTIEITVYDSINDNNIIGGSPQFTCYNSSKELIGTATGGGSGTPTFSWQNSADGTNWNNAGSSEQSYETPELIADTYYRRLVVSGAGGECKDTSSVVLLNINQLPVGDIVSKFDTLCAEEILELSYEGLSGNGPWIFELGEDAGSPLHTDTIQVSGAPSGTIAFDLSESASISILSLRDDSTCYADPSLITGIVQATVYEIPEANAGEDSVECGLTTTLNATLDKENRTGLWSSEYIETIDDATSPNAVVTVNTYEFVTLTWTVTTWGHCQSSDDVVIDFYEQPTEVEAGEDQVLAYNFMTTLDGNEPTGRANGHWKFVEGVGEFVDSTEHNTSITMVNVGEHLLRWTIGNGICKSISDSVKITINSLALPNGFSPNGDEINDFFTIYIPSGNLVKFTVLDRRGNVVYYEEGSIELIWDGTNDNGVELPVDTYFYIIEEEGVDPEKGFIDLRR